MTLVFLVLTSALHPITHFDYVLVGHERGFLSKALCVITFFADSHLLYKSVSIKKKKKQQNQTQQPSNHTGDQKIKELAQHFLLKFLKIVLIIKR